MNRESHRTTYIDKLYEAKDMNGLKEELKRINIIIESYSIDILRVLDKKHKGELLDTLQYERGIRDKIEDYLFDLLNKGESI